MRKLERVRGVALCLVVCGSALVGIFHVEAEALSVRPTPIAMPTPAPDAAPTTTRVAVAGTLAALTAVPLTAPEPEVTPVASVRVPHLVGLRLPKAMTRAERSGVRIIAVDEEGVTVDPADATYYRVLRQSVRRGTNVTPTQVIELRVRDRTASYSDWG